jgi:hypothetical protein
MSRITGNDVANLMEAYSAVYAPQELTEEQIWEEVESWVNSLVEEGYDLSDYTWEEMYEAYLDEIVRPTTGQMTAPKRDQAQTAARPAPQATRPAGGGMGGMRGTGRNRNATQTSSSPKALRVQPSPAAQAPVRPAAPALARPAAPAPAPARPAAPVATQGGARPTATPTTTTAPATTPAAPQRTFNPLMQRTFGYQTGYAPDQIKGDIKKMAAMGSIRNISSSFDVFDLIKGHLLDEGYADTEEAALQIMANMSEEWRESILEDSDAEAARKRYNALGGDANAKRLGVVK